LWLIQPFDDTIDKKLKKFRSNQPLIKNFTNFIEDLKTTDDPARLGESKHGTYKNCIGKHLTKSHALIYYVEYSKGIVWLVDLDDHKNLYGRDNRS
jgi:mRNA-degrading endonuclease YafQ of YafQ-DinJ toxin-antitoxin module